MSLSASCPLCGGENLEMFSYEFPHLDGTSIRQKIRCEDCEVDFVFDGMTREEAIKTWNTRNDNILKEK